MCKHVPVPLCGFVLSQPSILLRKDKVFILHLNPVKFHSHPFEAKNIFHVLVDWRSCYSLFHFYYVQHFTFFLFSPVCFCFFLLLSFWYSLFRQTIEKILHSLVTLQWKTFYHTKFPPLKIFLFLGFFVVAFFWFI